MLTVQLTLCTTINSLFYSVNSNVIRRFLLLPVIVGALVARTLRQTLSSHGALKRTVLYAFLGRLPPGENTENVHARDFHRCDGW